MTIRDSRVFTLWPDSLQSWFEKKLARTDLDKADRDRLERLASDDRMIPVANRLAKEERLWLAREEMDLSAEDRLTWLQIDLSLEELGAPPPGDMELLPMYMARAWYTPALWQSLKTKPRSKPGGKNRRKQLAELKKACDHLCRLLEIHQDVAESGVADYLFDKSHEDYHDEYLKLIATIRAVADQSGSEHEVNRVGPLNTLLPGRLTDANAEAAFCIRYIVGDALHFFGKPLYAEVAIIVTALLGLSKDIPESRVVELWSSRKRGVYRKVR